MRNSLLFALLLLPSMAVWGQSKPTSGELSHHVHFLASDQLEGRKPGSEGSRLAARYIRDDLRQSGVKLLGEDGFQYFSLVTGAEAGQGNHLSFSGIEAIADSQFLPLSFSANATVEAALAFVGYGMTVKNDTLDWDDYKGIDVKGKWVMILRADPLADKGNSAFTEFSAERTKVVSAIDRGAAGVIFVSGPSFDKEDVLGKVFFDKSPASASVPVFQVTRSLADLMLKASGKQIAGLEAYIIDGMAPVSYDTKLMVKGTADVRLTEQRTANVVGMVEGTDPVLRKEYIVIGAHYDHLGHGGPNSGSRVPDTLAVHNGADDNASGVAGVLEMAEYFAQHPGRRSIIFMAFGAEESGLVGSKAYVDDPLVPLDQTVAMVNFDMIGRMDPDDRNLMIGGTGTAVESEGILDSLLEGRSFGAAYSPEGYGASDHSSFYLHNIPVFFLSTGAHADYHKPSDDADLIDYRSQEEVLLFAIDLVNTISERQERLSFREAGPKGGGHRGRGYKITLGILPDFTGKGGNGLGVDGVRPDGPAEKGGMKKGDVIKAIEGQPVTNIYDYMYRLKSLEKGQLITVDVEREGQIKVLLITL